jgi:hypothetical protein
VVLGHVVGQAPTSIKDHGVIDNEKKKNGPDVVSAPTVGDGTTYEVRQ